MFFKRSYRFFFLLSGFFYLGFLSFSVCAQFKFEFKNDLPVTYNGMTGSAAFSGGLNNPQFSTIDFDFDGDEDLFIFDRSSNHIILYENVEENNQRFYRYVYNSRRFFPDDLNYRVALVDYDGDGKKDIFAAAVSGTKVYKNMGNATDGLSWKLVSPLLYSTYIHDASNLYISQTDIPAYTDVDNDGDIDILTFHLSGQRLEYHQNQSQELYGHSDSLIFELKNECWGKFMEDINGFEVVLSPDVSPCNDDTGVINPKSDPERHSGSTVLSLDYDNNGVKDLILGDVSYRYLNLLINGGTTVNTNSAIISQDIHFPNNSKRTEVVSFPASFYEDIDFDGVKDLLVAPNAKNSSVNKNSVWLYKNTNTDNQPVFEFQTKSFLQGNAIDVGTGSVPVFTDINYDGLPDLVIANYFEVDEDSSRKSTIHVFENHGTTSQPHFVLTDTNFLDVNSLGIGYRIIPAFGDLNGDGYADIVLGNDNGKLFLLQAGSANTFNTLVALQNSDGAQIQCSGGASPQLTDLNGDGLSDLVIGTRNGTIHYYENIGNQNNYIFKQISTQLGNVNVSENFIGYAVPHFFKENNEWHLLCGSHSGKLYFYRNIVQSGELSTDFELISSDFLGINTNGYSAPFVIDIDNDDQLNLFLGMELGGLWHFEHDPNSTIGTYQLEKAANGICVYPNPNQGTFYLSDNILLNEEDILITDISGRIIPFQLTNNFIQLHNCVSGTYIMTVLKNDKTQKKSLLIHIY